MRRCAGAGRAIPLFRREPAPAGTLRRQTWHAWPFLPRQTDVATAEHCRPHKNPAREADPEWATMKRAGSCQSHPGAWPQRTQRYSRQQTNSRLRMVAALQRYANQYTEGGVIRTPRITTVTHGVCPPARDRFRALAAAEAASAPIRRCTGRRNMSHSTATSSGSIDRHRSPADAAFSMKWGWRATDPKRLSEKCRTIMSSPRRSRRNETNGPGYSP